MEPEQTTPNPMQPIPTDNVKLCQQCRHYHPPLVPCGMTPQIPANVLMQTIVDYQFMFAELQTQSRFHQYVIEKLVELLPDVTWEMLGVKVVEPAVTQILRPDGTAT